VLPSHQQTPSLVWSDPHGHRAHGLLRPCPSERATQMSRTVKIIDFIFEEYGLISLPVSKSVYKIGIDISNGKNICVLYF